VAVFARTIDKPYLEAWLRRTGRQLAASGRLTQTAMVLAREDGGTVDEWRNRLRTLLEGGDTPSLDLLTRIDAILSPPSKAKSEDGQGLLF
jgi:hypothetical protein